MPDHRGQSSGPRLFGFKPLEDLTPTHNYAVPPWSGLLEAYSGQEEGTKSDLESEARLVRALDHFQAYSPAFGTVRRCHGVTGE
jgi:glycine/D-amino acid oxidase-like deaminating enzyme